MFETKNLQLKDLHLNKGQVEGLPQNPRFIKDKRFEALKKSIEEAPEMLSLRELIVYDNNGEYVIIGGNMRYRAMKDLGFREAPCKVLSNDTPTEKLREYTIKDNIGFGEDDFDLLANEWNFEELTSFGMGIPNIHILKDDTLEDCEETGEYAKEKYYESAIPVVENEVKSFLKRINYYPIIDKYYAKRLFLRALYLGEKYPRFANNAFAPIWNFNSKEEKTIDYLNRKPSCRSLITALQERKIDDIIKIGMPWGGFRICLDFPVEVARAAIKKFCKNKGRVLDPCHGWGGRLTASLLEGVSEYWGFDPSPVAHEGVLKQYEAFRDYIVTKGEFFLQPFEDATLNDDYFDFAITCPPYYDVEIYEGEDTSTTRYTSYNDWSENFLYSLIKKVFFALKKDCYFCIVVGSQKYPLKKDVIKHAKEIGFEIETTINKLTSGQSNSSFSKYDIEEDGETMIVLRK